MKRTSIILSIVFAFFAGIVSAQDFSLSNPTMTPNPAVFPGGNLTITFDFAVANQPYTFSSDQSSNSHTTIKFSFTKLNPTGILPTGTGADLFDWTLSDNGGSGAGLTYTWTGHTKSVQMLASPPGAKYKIVFTSVPVTMGATQAETDIRVVGAFVTPANVSADPPGNNDAQIATYSTLPLPVNFKSFGAKIVNNSLVVDWATMSETNNDYFEVQVMDTDSTFRTIGKVLTKAANSGTSDTALEYTFTKELDARGSLMGIAMFAIGFIALLFNRRNKLLYMLVVVAGLSITTISCRKESKEKIDQYDGDYRVRVVQVDKAGVKSLTKVAVAVRQ